jgi:hypothetical protein
MEYLIEPLEGDVEMLPLDEVDESLALELYWNGHCGETGK